MISRLGSANTHVGNSMQKKSLAKKRRLTNFIKILFNGYNSKLSAIMMIDWISNKRAYKSSLI